MEAKKSSLILSLILLITSICSPAWTYGCTTIYVDANAAGANNGTSWHDAYIFLQDALLDANNSAECDEIWAAAGTYKPDCNSAEPNGSGSREATFNLINNVVLYGGFPSGGGVWETRDPNDPDKKTILSGDLAPNYKSSRVVTGSETNETAILDGFTISDGSCGMYNEDSTTTIANCTFSEISGCGMYNVDCNSTITNCAFTGNLCGIYNENGSSTITNCTFSQNSGGYPVLHGGGGICDYYCNSTITNCTFSENSADNGSGGGLYNFGGKLKITDCTFIGNSATVQNYGEGGGGICDINSNSTIIANCSFSGNSTNLWGGGIYLVCGNSTITNCTFTGNSAYGQDGGGGIYLVYGNSTITNCTFSENLAQAGGGLFNFGNKLTITDCTFSGNSAYGTDSENVLFEQGGGGMWNGYPLIPVDYNIMTVISNCKFIGNHANNGGGISSYVSSYITQIVNCIFSGNSADSNGGGIYTDSNNLYITNCIFNGNSANSGGGGIYSNYDGVSTITNCTFSGNSAGYGGGICGNPVSTTNITNCILYNDTASHGNEIALLNLRGPGYLYPSTADVNYSDVNGGSAGVYKQTGCTLNWGPGNIDKDPCFVGGGNYRLLSESNCIDAGDNNSVPPDYADLDDDEDTSELTPLDLDNLARFIDGDNNGSIIVDMGAYEFPCPYVIIGDLNGDCSVDFHDLKIMAANWLGSRPRADIEPPSRDGIVNFRDFAALAEDWLINCPLTPSNPTCVPK